MSTDNSKISSSELEILIKMKKNIKIIDVRDVEEYRNGHIPKAICVPLKILEYKIEDYLDDKDEIIVVYCLTGARSNLAEKMLLSLGFSNVKNFGSINSWTGPKEK